MPSAALILFLLLVLLSVAGLSLAAAAEGYVDEQGFKRNADGTLDHHALNLKDGREAHRDRKRNQKDGVERPPLTSSTEALHGIQDERHRRIREHRREQRELDKAISHSLKAGLVDKSKEPHRHAVLAHRKSLSLEEQQAILRKFRRSTQEEANAKKTQNQKTGVPSYSQEIKLDAEEMARRRMEDNRELDVSLEAQHAIEKHANKIRIEMESSHPPGVNPTAKNYGLRYQATHMATFHIYVQSTESHNAQREADKTESHSFPLARRGPLSRGIEGKGSSSASPSLSPHADQDSPSSSSSNLKSKSLSKPFTHPTPLMDPETDEVDLTQYTELGNMTFALFGKSVPWTVTNFIGLCHGDRGFGYVNSTIHRIVQDYVFQGGDFEYHDGRGGHSYFCDESKDELCDYKTQRDEIRKERSSKSKSKSFSVSSGAASHRRKLHNERTHFRHENYNVPHTEGTLSMADDDKSSTGSQWFLNINHQSNVDMDKKFVAFGHIVHGFRTTGKSLNFMRTDAKHRPIRSLLIKGCHVEPFAGREVAWQYEHERGLLYGDIPTGTSTLRRMTTERGGADWREHQKKGGSWDSLQLWMSNSEVPSSWVPLAGGTIADRSQKRKQIRDEDDEYVAKARELGSKEILSLIAEDAAAEKKSVEDEVERIKVAMVQAKLRTTSSNSDSASSDEGALASLRQTQQQHHQKRRPTKSIIPQGLDPSVHTENDITKAVLARRQAAASRRRKGPKRVYEHGMGLYYGNYDDEDEEEQLEDPVTGAPKVDEHDEMFDRILAGPAKGSHQAAHSIRDQQLRQREERKQAFLTRRKERSSKSLPLHSAPPGERGEAA